MVKERLEVIATEEGHYLHPALLIFDKVCGYWRIGSVRAEIIEGNVVITVEREDVEKFGPVSTVVI
jgi:hypothetical protein